MTCGGIRNTAQPLRRREDEVGDGQQHPQQNETRTVLFLLRRRPRGLQLLSFSYSLRLKLGFLKTLF